MEKEEASEDELEQSNLLTKNDAACREELDGWHSSTAASTCAGGHKSSRTLYSLPLQLQQRTCILSVGAGPCKHDQRHHRTTTPTRLPSAVEGVGHYISRAPCVLPSSSPSCTFTVFSSSIYQSRKCRCSDEKRLILQPQLSSSMAMSSADRRSNTAP